MGGAVYYFSRLEGVNNKMQTPAAFAAVCCLARLPMGPIEMEETNYEHYSGKAR